MQIQYKTCKISDLVATTETVAGKSRVKTIAIDDQPMKPSDRFWQSMFSLFGFNKTIFRYFSHAETFDRISQVAKNDRIRVCIQDDNDSTTGNITMLGCSNPKKPVVAYDDIMELLEKKKPVADTDKGGIDYHNGIVRSNHKPAYAADWEVGGDLFSNRYVMDTPIDGYGKPSIYLSVLRAVCVNGAVMSAPAFRAMLNLGRGESDYTLPITRAMDSYNNEDGYLAVRQRIGSAQKSWASIAETQKLYKALQKAHSNGGIELNVDYLKNVKGWDGAKTQDNSPLMRAYNEMVGDITKVYGLANLDALSAKRQRALPAPCKVYDLMNFATEVASHHATPTGARIVQAFVGDLVAGGQEYDLEGTVDKFSDYRDLFIGNEDTIEAKVSLDQLN